MIRTSLFLIVAASLAAERSAKSSSSADNGGVAGVAPLKRRLFFFHLQLAFSKNESDQSIPLRS